MAHGFAVSLSPKKAWSFLPPTDIKTPRRNAVGSLGQRVLCSWWAELRGSMPHRHLSFHVQTCCLGYIPASFYILAMMRPLSTTASAVTDPLPNQMGHTSAPLPFWTFFFDLLSTYHLLTPAFQAPTRADIRAWSRHQQCFRYSGDMLRHLLPLLVFPSANHLSNFSTWPGHAQQLCQSRSNLVLSPLLIQKGLQQLAQAGSLSYKKLTQLPIPQFLGSSL